MVECGNIEFTPAAAVTVGEVFPMANLNFDGGKTVANGHISLVDVPHILM